MVQCAIEGCSSRSDTQPSAFTESAIHFHRVPTDTLIRQKWMQTINKREVKAGTRVCSLHFKKENYYLTKQGLHKLTGGAVPEIKLPYVEEVKEDSSCEEEMRNVLPPEPNISNRSQSKQTSTKEITPEIGRAVNVLESTNIKYVEDVKDDTTGSSTDEETSNVQPLEYNINQSQSQQKSTKVIMQKIGTTVLGSTKYIKPGVQKHKVKTLLERKLLKEVRRLQEQGKRRMELISCLLEQNRRVLDRNSFLEQELKYSEKVALNVDNEAQ